MVTKRFKGLVLFVLFTLTQVSFGYLQAGLLRNARVMIDENRSKAVQNIKVGKTVLTAFPNSDVYGQTIVAARWIFTTSKLVHIYTRSGLLTVSATERVYSVTKNKCINATKLTTDDSLLSFDYDVLPITDIQIIELEEPINTYGVSIPFTHMIFVEDSGGTPILVHNFGLTAFLTWLGFSTTVGGSTTGAVAGTLATVSAISAPVLAFLGIKEAVDRHRRGEPIIRITTGFEDPDFTTPEGIDRAAEELRREIEADADLARPYYSDDPFAQRILDDMPTSERYSQGDDIATYVERARLRSETARLSREATERGLNPILADYGDGEFRYVGARPRQVDIISEKTFDDVFDDDAEEDPASDGKDRIKKRPEAEFDPDFDDFTEDAPQKGKKTTPKGEIEVATLPNGDTLVKRHSKDGRKTIEKQIRDEEGDVVDRRKLRYGDK